MSTRRSFLQSVVFLPSILSAHAFAQDTQNSTSVSFADFENGWGDWTTEGLAFGTRPATDALFPGKINGFGRRGFVCTLHPRKGNAATGKAVSREFVIEKPFITFKIGGGNFPGQACLNLVVDGKIERTATGDGTANLSEKSWDVSTLVGKKARLEIVDNTVSDQRGYVLVDDIQFSKRPSMRPQDMLEQRGITPHFLQYSRFYENDEQRTSGRFLSFGISEEQFDRATDDVWLRMCDTRYAAVTDIPLDRIAGFVKEAVSSTEDRVKQTLAAVLNDLGHQWLLAEAACAWCVTNIKLDEELDKASQKGEKFDIVNTQLPEVTLHKSPPTAMCSGYSLVLRDVSRKVGLTSHILQGKVRLPISGGTGGHCWTVFTFPDNIIVPADTSRAASREEVLRYGGKIRRFTNLPRRREEWELYHATYYNWTPIPKNIIDRGDPRESVVLLNMPEQDWLAFDTYGAHRGKYFPLRDKLLRR